MHRALAKSGERISELDGIRGLAILLVMLFHFRSSPLTHPTLLKQGINSALGIGWCGVDLFFVLSGFLITGILLDSKGATNYYSVFYWRRAVRILPLYYMAVLAMFIIVPSAAKWIGFRWPYISPWEQVWYWLHISNWRTAFYPVVYGEVSAYWSLAIEEQFYFLWPIVVLKNSPGQLIRICIGSMLACLILRNIPQLQAINAEYSNFFYRLTPFRVDALLFGALAALIVRDSRSAARVRRFLPVGIILGVGIPALAIVVSGTTSPHSRAMGGFGYSALGVLFGCIILYGHWLSGSAHPLARLFRFPVLTTFGKYSYAMYIAHFQLGTYIPFPFERLGSVEAVLRLLFKIAATFVAALISWYCFERYFLKLRKLKSYEFAAKAHLAQAL